MGDEPSGPVLVWKHSRLPTRNWKPKKQSAELMNCIHLQSMAHARVQQWPEPANLESLPGPDFGAYLCYLDIDCFSSFSTT